MKKLIKVSCVPNGVDMSRYFSKIFFQNYIFEVNNPEIIECDYWIVFGGLNVRFEQVNVSPENIFLIAGEFDGGYNKAFLEQFSRVFTVDPRLSGNNIKYYHLGLPWFINKNFDELYDQNNIPKPKLLSIISSNLSYISYSRNYKIRFDFINALKTHFGDSIDIFGRGFNEIPDKGIGLYPYKFTIALENIPLPYNITEKLYDCFLTHTYPFYYDCNNIYRFVDEKAFTRIDIMDHKYSITIIEDILSQPNFYKDHLNSIISAKKHYLLNYSFQGILVDVVEKFGKMHSVKKLVTIRKNNELRSKLKLRSIDLAFNFLK